MNKKIIIILITLIILFGIIFILMKNKILVENNKTESLENKNTENVIINNINQEENKMIENNINETNISEIKLKVNNNELVVKLENNEATKELIGRLKENDITIAAKEYGGFEKVGNLGFSLTREDKTINTEPGDIVLYNGNQISVFYDSNSWSYTRIGKIINKDKNELKNILGNGNVTLTFSIN